MKLKYEKILNENLEAFENEIKELKSQFFNLRMTIISKDGMIKKLHNILAKQEQYITNFRSAITPRLDLSNYDENRKRFTTEDFTSVIINTVGKDWKFRLMNIIERQM